MAEPSNQGSSYRWVILFLTALVGFIGSYAQYQIPVMAYKLIPALKLTPSQFASIVSAPMLPAIFFSIAAGSMADRYGVKKVVNVGLVAAIIGITFRYAATNYWEFLILMALTGCSSAFLNANISKLLGAWFPSDMMGRAMGIYLVGPTIAMFVGSATTALFPTLKSAYLTAGILCLVIAAAWVAFLKDKPEGAPEMPSMPVAKYLGVAAKSKNVWLVGVIMMFVMGAAMGFGDFFPNALHAVRGISPVTAGILSSIGMIGSFLGSLLGPVICDRVGLIKPVVFVMGVLGALGMYFVFHAPMGAVMIVILIANGFVGAAFSPPLMSYPMLLPEIGSAYAGSAGGLIATMQLIGAFCIPTFIITPLASNNYDLIFKLSAAFFLMAAIVVLFIPELGVKARAKAESKAA